MKKLAMFTVLTCATLGVGVAAIGPAAQPAAPVMVLDEQTLTVSGASYAHVLNAMGNSGDLVTLEQGEPIGDPSWGRATHFEPDIVWTLAPGQYTVQAWSEMDDLSGQRVYAEWTIDVPAASRVDQLWTILASMDALRAQLDVLDPSDQELLEALNR